jgi:hypothetical protein
MVKCYIDNSIHLQRCIRNINSGVVPVLINRADRGSGWCSGHQWGLVGCPTGAYSGSIALPRAGGWNGPAWVWLQCWPNERSDGSSLILNPPGLIVPIIMCSPNGYPQSSQQHERVVPTPWAFFSFILFPWLVGFTLMSVVKQFENDLILSLQQFKFNLDMLWSPQWTPSAGGDWVWLTISWHFVFY